MLVGLLAFMMSNEPTTGSLFSSSAKKRTQAKGSLSYNLGNPQFVELFKDHLGQLKIEIEKADGLLKESEEQAKLEPDVYVQNFIYFGLFCIIVYFINKHFW